MTDEADLSSAIAALWERQRDEMMRRVDIVDAGVAALRAGTLDPSEREETERAAHKIAGSAGSFGYADASRDARVIELALRSGDGDAGGLAELVTAIRRDLQRAPSLPGAAPPAPVPAPTRVDVLIVGDGAGVDQIQAELTQRNLAVGRVADPESSGEVGATVAVVDLAHGGGEIVKRLAQAGTAVIGLGGDTGLEARVEFAHSGGRMLLPADAPPGECADAAETLHEHRSDDRTRVLVVDDDPAILDVTTTILHSHGLDVSWLDDPKRFWQVLEAGNPDVLLLDLEMPGFNGLELCQAVRSDPRWGQLPILFLTGRTEPESIRAVYAAGADDYMAKPVVEEELIQRIHNRLERLRLLRDLADRDPLTGVANRRKATEQLRRLERLAKRYGQPLTLVMLDLDHFKQVNDAHGHDVGDEVLHRLGRRLQREFRGEDVVCRWGGEEFLIGLYGIPATVARDRMASLLEDWKAERFRGSGGHEFTITFTAGLAELPAHGDTVAALQQRADQALYRGKTAGRSQVAVA